MTTTLLTAGLVCIIAAIIGGGLNAFGINMPLVQSVKRQLALGLFGVTLLGAAYFTQPNINNNKESPKEIVQCETVPPLKLNEICAEGKDCDGEKDFVELYNPNPTPVDLSCFALVDKNQHRKILSGILGPKEIRAWNDDDLGFGLSKDDDKISLMRILSDGGEQILDQRDIDSASAYQQRIPDGGDSWEYLSTEEVEAIGNVGSRNGQNLSHK